MDRLKQLQASLRMKAAESAKQSANAAAARSRLPWFAPEEAHGPDDEGYLIRFLEPSYLSALGLDPFLTYLVYRVMVGGKWRKFVCPFQFGMPDPIWERRQELYPSRNESEEASKFCQLWYPTTRHLILVQDQDLLEEEGMGIAKWDFPLETAGALVNMLYGRFSTFWILDPLKGCNVSLTRRGTGTSTKYYFQPDVASPGPIGGSEKFAKTVMERVNKIDLARLLEVETEDTLIRLMEDRDYDWEEAADLRKARDAEGGFPGLLLSNGKPNETHPIVLAHHKKLEDYQAKQAKQASSKASGAGESSTAPKTTARGSSRKQAIEEEPRGEQSEEVVESPNGAFSHGSAELQKEEAPVTSGRKPRGSKTTPKALPKQEELPEELPEEEEVEEPEVPETPQSGALSWEDAEKAYVGKTIVFEDGEDEISGVCSKLIEDTEEGSNEPYILVVGEETRNGREIPEVDRQEREVTESLILEVRQPPAPKAPARRAARAGAKKPEAEEAAASVKGTPPQTTSKWSERLENTRKRRNSA